MEVEKRDFGFSDDPQTYAIIGAAMEVHSTLGSGFLEAVYHDALAVEFGLRNIPYQREPLIRLTYKGIDLQSIYRPDFLCFGSIVVELKALHTIGPIEHAQVINYLKATGHWCGLLLNFGSTSLFHRRLVNGPRPSTSPPSNDPQ